MSKLKTFKSINSIVITNKVTILLIMLEINIFLFGRSKSVEPYFNSFPRFYVLISPASKELFLLK
ncbi:hypothetical protein BC30090_4569 [Bacillus cereus]|nr:hypothetical protein BC30090_4569 [Bacillus cereus]